MTRRLMAGRFRQVDEDGVVGRCEPGRLLDGPFDLRHPVMEAIDHRRHQRAVRSKKALAQ